MKRPGTGPISPAGIFPEAYTCCDWSFQERFLKGPSHCWISTRDGNGIIGIDPGLQLLIQNLPSTRIMLSVMAPGLPEPLPGLPGLLPGLPETTPGLPGVTPGLPGVTPGVPGMAPGLPGMTPGLPGTTPGLPGVTPGAPGCLPGFPGSISGDPFFSSLRVLWSAGSPTRTRASPACADSGPGSPKRLPSVALAVWVRVAGRHEKTD